MKCTPYHDFYGQHCLPNTGMNLLGVLEISILALLGGLAVIAAGSVIYAILQRRHRDG